MTKGCKIWLWVIFVSNVLATVLGIGTIAAAPKAGIFTVLAGVTMVTGIGLLLFKQKKVGFYILAGVTAVSAVFNIMNGVNVIFALISAVISPAITYYFINKNSSVIK